MTPTGALLMTPTRRGRAMWALVSHRICARIAQVLVAHASRRAQGCCCRHTCQATLAHPEAQGRELGDLPIGESLGAGPGAAPHHSGGGGGAHVGSGAGDALGDAGRWDRRRVITACSGRRARRHGARLSHARPRAHAALQRGVPQYEAGVRPLCDRLVLTPPLAIALALALA